jgi:N-acetylglucosamine-6-phosphate deacetylase
MRVAGRVVTPTGVLDSGYVEVDGDRITAVGRGGGGGSQWIVPGFVDIHVHGGGGHSFTTGDPDAARGAAEFHLRRGTTTMLASLVSSPYELMREATAAFAPLVAEGVLAGIHYEGPYLSETRCGAQNPAYLRDPSMAELADLLELGGGAVRMVTLAPERAGALDAIRMLTANGVVAAVGHTDATYEQTLACAHHTTATPARCWPCSARRRPPAS